MACNVEDLIKMEQVLIRDSRCRLCLSRSNQMENLFTSDSIYKFIVEDFTGLKIESNTKLPSMICKGCIAVINTLLEFRLTCKKSQEVLESGQNILENEAEDENEVNNDVMDMLDIKLENDDDDEDEFDISDDISSYDSIQFDDNDRQKKIIVSKSSTSETQKIKQVEVKTKLESVKIKESAKEKKCNKSKAKNKKSEVRADTNTEEKSITTNKKYVGAYNTPCYICGKLLRKFSMEYHINSHLNRRPFECTEDGCNKAFTSPRQLRQHTTHCHSDYAPFVCEICSRAFKTPSALKIHKTYHFDPQIPCSLCGKLLRNKKSMRIHMFSHSGERPYKCSECPKDFKSMWPLKVHYSKHHATESAEHAESSTTLMQEFTQTGETGS